MSKPKTPPRALSPPRIVPIVAPQIVQTPIRKRCSLQLNEQAASEIVYGMVTLQRARPVIVSTLHHLLSLVSLQLSTIVEDDFAVFVTLDKPGKEVYVVLASYGTMQIVEKEIPWEKAICHVNPGFMVIAHIGVDKRTCQMPFASSRINSYVGEKIENLSLSIVTTREIPQDSLSLFASSFKEVTGILRDLLKESNDLLLAESMTRLAEQRKAEWEHQKKLRELERDTNRYFKHEIKNSLIGILDDIDALRRAVTIDNAAIAEGLEGIEADLSNALESLFSTHSVSEIIAKTYEPRLGQVDLGLICSTLSVPVPNGVSVHPSSFVVETDKTLFRTIVTNAVSNAVKYGDPTHPVTITFSSRESDENDKVSNVHVEIVNAAGKAQTLLASLPNPNVIFKQGWRLQDLLPYDDRDKVPQENQVLKGHETDDDDDDEGAEECDQEVRKHSLSESSKLSAGDGAWIMQRSAFALNGKCSISFKEQQTKFVLDFPVKSCVELDAATRRSNSPTRLYSPYYDYDSDDDDNPKMSSSSPFEPEKALFVALDDMSSQRYHLSILFKDIGAPHRIYGEDPDTPEIFVESARELVSENQDVKVVFFLDNVLRFDRPDGSSVTASGIRLGEQLREKLAQDGNEYRTLILSRTADDSREIIQHCRQVLHDHFPKAPMNYSKFRQALEKRWNRRFGREGQEQVAITGR